jgi:hypothetical protein
MGDPNWWNFASFGRTLDWEKILIGDSLSESIDSMQFSTSLAILIV